MRLHVYRIAFAHLLFSYMFWRVLLSETDVLLIVLCLFGVLMLSPLVSLCYKTAGTLAVLNVF